jgi:hypothetical protein
MTTAVREMDNFLEDIPHMSFKSKVTAPKNPKLIREPKKAKKVKFFIKKIVY